MARVINSRSRGRSRQAKFAPKNQTKQPLQERSRVTRDIILRATAQLLIRDGYDTLSTNRVAEHAGVSIGSLYRYFDSKEALVAALVDEHVEDTMRVLRREVSSLLMMPIERAVPHLVELMIEMHRVQPELHRVLVEQLPRVGDFEKIETSMKEGLAMTRAYLEVHAGEIVPQDLDMAAFIVVTSVEALTHGAVLTRPEWLDNPQLVAEISAMLVRYLVADGRPPATQPS